MHSVRLTIAVAAALTGTATLAAPAHKSGAHVDSPSSTDSTSLNFTKIEFRTRSEAESRCAKEPITEKPDGSFECSVPKATYNLKTNTK